MARPPPALAVSCAGGRLPRLSLGRDGEPAFTLVFRKPRAYWRIPAFGPGGLLESYFDGDIDLEGNLARAMAAGLQGGIDRPNGVLGLLDRAHEVLHNNPNRGR